MPLGPFDLTGGPFLMLYGGLLVAAIVAALVIPRWLRPEGRPGRAADADQLACLAGGQERFIDTIVARLLSADMLRVSDKKLWPSGSRSNGRTAAEMAVLALPGPIEFPAAKRALADYAEPVMNDLERKGLMMDSGAVLQMRFWQASPFLALIVFGVIKWEVGTVRDKPVGILTVLLLATLILAIVRFCMVDRRTRAGIGALKAAQVQSARLRRAPVAAEVPLAVALFGTTILAGSAWSGYHDLRRAGGDGGGSSSSSDGDGGGGGGCGGCGGD